ncbi:protein adenylyltransferase SelO [Nesterenkonia marinintestina]|uniref:protein adenylyltransferase SelO n=1 Tax=Nesterenkonia marinintestina TaxID=2979865 RepID=UPI0021C1165A|nr:YdiU family protein [Nesterenkonia sp. GX14115]
MSGSSQQTTRLTSRFVDDLPELTVPWQAAEPPEPRLLVLNDSLAAELGFDPEILRGPDGSGSEAGLGLLTGTAPPTGAQPVAQAYVGHQFGTLNPRLGDGRALLLGEVQGPDGEPHDIHLKGSGRTPFARGGDGFAAVGPMLREYLVSEAMHALGIPTTRALSVVATGARVHRERVLPGAVLARVARSHVRVGSFQFAQLSGDEALLRRLADHAIDHLHPQAREDSEPHLGLFERVVSVQADLVAQWMLVGFVHGVMNTDNMTISGETIDYGPCAFMDAFDPSTVYSSIDTGGRYAFANQPLIAEWNLARFAEALLPLLGEDEESAVGAAQEALGRFRTQYSAAWTAGMRHKLGLGETVSQKAAADVMDALPTMLQKHEVDYTSFFRGLADAEAQPRDAAAGPNAGVVAEMLTDVPDFAAWLESWRGLEPETELMRRCNPIYIPRNHLVEEALDAGEAGDMEPFTRLLEAVTDPYTERPGLERYALPAPESFGPYRTFCGT